MNQPETGRTQIVIDDHYSTVGVGTVGARGRPEAARRVPTSARVALARRLDPIEINSANVCRDRMS